MQKLIDAICDAMRPDPRGMDIPMTAKEVVEGAAWLIGMYGALYLLLGMFA